MKRSGKIISGILCTAALMTNFSAVSYADTTSLKVYVKPAYGNDENDGSSLNQAVKTVERAQEIARERVREGKKVEVILDGGTYCLDSALRFTSEDSGASEDMPVIYRPSYGQHVKFTAAKKLDKNSFTRSADNRLTGGMFGKVYEISLADLNIAGGVKDTVCADGEHLQISRYPNEGRVYYARGETKDGDTVTDSWLNIPEEKYGVWTDENGMLFSHYTGAYTMGIASVIPGSDRISAAGNTSRSGIIYNAVSEIDMPGEYAIDAENKKLFYYPKGEMGDLYFSPGRTANTVPEPTVTMNGTEHLRFENIDFFCGSDIGLDIENCNDVVLYNSSITGYGSYGIYADNTTKLLICGSEIYNMKGKGVHISGGNQVRLEPSYNEIRTTGIHDYAQINETGNPGLELGGVGVTVKDNEIYNSPHLGITFSGNDHVIENNRIWNTMKNTWDSGAIYAMRSWVGRGTVIRNNYIYNTTEVRDFVTAPDNEYFGSLSDNQGIYIDDLQSGITVYGNIMYNLERGIQIGGGSDNTVENNAIIECRRALIYDNFGAGNRNQHINPTYVYQAQVYRELFELFKNPEYSQAKWEEHYPTWKNVEGKWNTFHANEDCKFLLDFESYDALRKYMGYQGESQLTTKQKSSILTNSKIMGYVQNGVIKDNLLIGKYFDSYDKKGYDVHRYFTYPEEKYRVDCNMDENPRCKRAPASVLDVNNYEFTLDGSYFNDSVTRSTSDMGLKPETEYIPSWSEDELGESDVNPGNRFTAVAAIYDGNGTLAGVQTFDRVYLYGGQDLDVSVKIPEKAKSDWTMSLMLWDGIDKMIPVAQKTKLIGSD